MDREHWLTPNEAAQMLLVSPVTARQWARKGLLEHRCTLGGHRRFAVELVRRFAARSGLAGRPEGVQQRVLVADEDAHLNRFIVSVLDEVATGASVTGATDAFQAGRTLERLQPDIFLFDPMMNGLDAFTVCRWLEDADSTRQIRLIAMTDAFSGENSQRLPDAGADEFLHKPFTNEALLAAAGLADDAPGSVARVAGVSRAPRSTRRRGPTAAPGADRRHLRRSRC